MDAQSSHIAVGMGMDDYRYLNPDMNSSKALAKVMNLSEALAKVINKLPLQPDAGKPRTVVCKDDDKFYLLDPDLWEHLPEEILMRIAAKLALHKWRPCAFLSKRWKTELVREAATLAAPGPGVSSLLCLQPWILESESGPECSVHVCNSDGHCYEALKSISSGFINPWWNHDRMAQIVAAVGGLLFFSVVQQGDYESDNLILVV